MTNSDINNLSLDDFHSSYETITKSLLDREIDEANDLKSRLDELEINFEGFDSSKYDREVWQALLDDMQMFENTVSNFSILLFFYGYLSRAALNAMRFKEAILYSNAGLELCKTHQDMEGVQSYTQKLCDIATAIGCFDQAVEFFKISNPSSTPEDNSTLQMLVYMSENSEKKDITLRTDIRPESFKYFDTEHERKEQAIRALMKVMNVSRSVSMKYYKASINTELE